MIYLIDECYSTLRSSHRDLVFTYFNKIKALLNNGVQMYTENSPVDSGDKLLLGVFGNPATKSGYVTERGRKLITNAGQRFAADATYCIIEDMHEHTYNMGELTSFIKDKHVILTYDECDESAPFKNNALSWHWIPHHVDLNMFNVQCFFEDRLKDFFFYGNRNPDVYPERVEMLKQLEGRVFVLEHPGYFMISHHVVQDTLAHYINTARRSIVSPSKFNYAVAKYFEVAACGTVLFGQSCPDIDKLGFKVTQSENEDEEVWRHNLKIVENFGLDDYVEKVKQAVGHP